jgi:hypothetical protein
LIFNDGYLSIIKNHLKINLRSLDMSVSLTNSIDIVANSVSIISPNGAPVSLVNIIEDELAGIAGNLTPEQLQNISDLSTALNDDPDFFQTIADGLDAKADKTETYTISQGSNSYTISFDNSSITNLYTATTGNRANGCSNYYGYTCNACYNNPSNNDPSNNVIVYDANLFLNIASINNTNTPTSNCPNSIGITTQNIQLYKYNSVCSNNSINSFYYSYQNTPVNNPLYFTISSTISSNITQSQICGWINGTSKPTSTTIPASYTTTVNYYSSSTTSTPIISIVFTNSYSSGVLSVSQIQITGTNVSQDQLFAAISNTCLNNYGASSIIYQNNQSNISSNLNSSLYNLCAGACALASQILIQDS